MTDKSHIYGRYLIDGREALCIEDNYERVELHYADEFTVLWRHSFDALKPTSLSTAERGGTS